MSQITERRNVISIDEIPWVQEVRSSMVNLAELSDYSPANVSMPDLESFCPQDIISALNAHTGGLIVDRSTVISSPASLRSDFATRFRSTVQNLQASNLEPADVKKAALLSTVSQMDFKVTDKATFNRNLKAVIDTTDEKVLSKSMERVMQGLEADHTKAFEANLARACAVASAKVGFERVTVKPVNGKLQVIATNIEGRHLLSEISVDKQTQRVDCSTEPIGITDGSCTKIMEQFNDELRKMRIKVGEESTQVTGGACQLPYAQMLDRLEKEDQRRQKARERTRKLNRSQKIRH